MLRIVSKSTGPFRRPQAAEIARRLRGLRRFIQIVAGARQVGKTTLVQQVTENLAEAGRHMGQKMMTSSQARLSASHEFAMNVA